jgi:hypothetical protein
MEVISDGLLGLDAWDFDMDADLLERLTSSRKKFQQFVEGHWEHVCTAAFAFQIQPLNPGLQPVLIFAHPARAGKARSDQTVFLTALNEICGQGRITVGEFARTETRPTTPSRKNRLLGISRSSERIRLTFL